MQSLIPVISAKDTFPLCELFERAHCEMRNSLAVDGVHRRQIGTVMRHLAIHHAYINPFRVSSRMRADLWRLILRLHPQNNAPLASLSQGTSSCWLLGERHRTRFIHVIPREDIFLLLWVIAMTDR